MRGPPDRKKICSPNDRRFQIFFKLIHRFLNIENSILVHEPLVPGGGTGNVGMFHGPNQNFTTDEKNRLRSGQTLKQIFAGDFPRTHLGWILNAGLKFKQDFAGIERVKSTETKVSDSPQRETDKDGSDNRHQMTTNDPNRIDVRGDGLVPLPRGTTIRHLHRPGLTGSDR